MKRGRPASGALASSALLCALLCTFICTGLVFLTGGCARRSSASHKAPAVNGLPRADPGYLQWLDRQSMLGRTQELAAQVSGSERLWLNSGAARRAPILLRAAPNWLALDPASLTARQPLFRALASARLPARLRALGFEGLFLAPVGEQADIWTSGETHGQNLAQGGSGVTSFVPDSAWGSAADWARLAETAEEAGVQLGGELPPAATGAGPDFILQARQTPRFGGVYAMISVPREAWPDLPKAVDEWDLRPLDAATVARLAERGLLPPRLRRESLPWAAPSGWAATGEVRGIDGQIRRWVYRCGPDATRPVLHWEDPSGRARRIFSAASIRQTGLEGQSLTGLRFEALLGLDVAPENAANGEVAPPERAALAPGLQALDEAAREIHRYGGWALQADALPLMLAPLILEGPVDFTRDADTPRAAARALAEGDAEPLAASLRAALALQFRQSRCARGPVGEAEAFPELAPDTAASLALRALGLPPRPPVGAGEKRALAEACLFLLGWRIGLPGLAFFSPQELSGALAPQDAGQGLTPLWEEASGQAGKAQPLRLAFGSLARQESDAGSFLARTSRLLLVRKAAGLAQGELLAVSGGKDGWLAATSSLPDGGMWLVVGNVAQQRRRLVVLLPQKAARARDAEPDRGGLAAPRLVNGGRAVEVELDGRQCRHVLLEKD